MSARAPLLLLATALMAALTPAAAQDDPPPLRFCLETGNHPMSAVGPDRGIDVDLARAIGESLGRPAEFSWYEPGSHLDEPLRAGECDITPGAVLAEGSLARSGTAPGIALSRPYAAAGYVLVARAGAGSVRGLEELGEQRVGVEMESVAIYTLKQRGNRVYALDDYDAVFRALADGRISYGYLWGPIAAWRVGHFSELRLIEEFQPVEFWDLALAVRQGEPRLRESLDQAIGELVEAGEIAAIFQKHDVPYLWPSIGR